MSMRTKRVAALVLTLAGMSAALPVATVAQRASRARSVRATTLEADASAQPLGIDDPRPRLSWALESGARGVLQRAYRVQVASRPELLRTGRPDVWDTHEVATAEPWVEYAGPALRSRTRYYWTVRVETTSGASTGWASPTWFETALLRPDEWHGRWIAGPERRLTRLTPQEGIADDQAIRPAGEFCRPVGWLTTGFAAQVPNNQGECRELRPAPMLRRNFQVRKPVARARIYAAGLGYDFLTVNGARVTDDLLEPGFTNYSRTVLYTTHDITSLLRSGENVVASVLGSGQYDGATRTWDWGWDEAEWRASPRLRLDLWLTYADGTEEVVSSDASWRMSVAGPTRFDSYYLGETYDARRELRGWDSPGYDASAWSPVRLVDAPAGTLRAQAHEPIRVVSVRPAGRRMQPAPGVYVYDIGQNLTGWAAIRVRAPAGTPVQLFYSEKRDSTGRASTAGNDLVYGQLQTDFYVARGAGEETWTPRFSYKGFQYLQISGPGGAPLPQTVSVDVVQIRQVRSALPATSSFASGSATLNRIHRNTLWAVQSNLFGIITDTPVYEKNGWTGDAQLTSGTASTLLDTERLYRKMFQDMLDAQTAQGEVSLLSPSNRNYGYVGKPFFKPPECCGATPPWDAFWFVIPWESYLRFGDRRALAQTYPAMRRYLDDWIPRWTDKDGDALAHTLTSGLGDWVPPQGVPTLEHLASTAYYARMVRIAGDAARVLGRGDDAARYDSLFQRIRADFNAAFLRTDGVYREAGGTAANSAGPTSGGASSAGELVQTAQILPLAFGLVPDSLRAAVAARLADHIRGRRGGNAYVGVLGARYVLPVLTETGHLDVAYQAATQTDEPSWGYWTDVAGFTALGEHWSATTRSLNHHMFGSIVQWLYEDLAGMRPLEPGYARIEFRPEIPASGLDSVSASYRSVRGVVASRWRRTAAGLELDVTVPPNATGRVYVPASRAEDIVEAGAGRPVVAERAVHVHLVGVEGDRVVYDIGSGTYRFRAPRMR